jgi:hypothetical protein
MTLFKTKTKAKPGDPRTILKDTIDRAVSEAMKAHLPSRYIIEALESATQWLAIREATTGRSDFLPPVMHPAETLKQSPIAVLTSLIRGAA